MGLITAGAVLAAAVLDALVGEPPERWHPVAWFGRAVGPLDRDWRHPTPAGLLIAVGPPLVAGAAGWGATRAAAGVDPLATGVVAALALFATTSHRRLWRTASDTLAAVDHDPAAARESIPALVGRDPTGLSPPELRSAAVESAAENLSDGLVAPLLAFVIGGLVSLPLAVAAAVWVKAVNTLDSMVGYPDRRHGWAAARLDDVVMWIPARLTAVLIALAAGSLVAIRRARSWARIPHSPNAGWPMATLAAVLDARLVKPGAYVLNPGAELPDSGTAARGVAVVRTAGWLAFALAGVAAWR
jgi:adenosylcobinamide-phosphate synthase